MKEKLPISEYILLSKGIHRDEEIIWLNFSRRNDWLVPIRSLEHSKYSRTKVCWHIPYSTEAYNEFLALKLPYKLSGTHEEKTNFSKKEDPASQHDNTSISIQQNRNSGRPSSGLEGADIPSKQIQLDWNSGKFYLAMPYNKKVVQEVKKLEGAWWHNDAKKWICKATIKNLEALQKLFQLYTIGEFQKIFDAISQVENPCKIIMYTMPKHSGKAIIEVIGYGANHSFIKKISGRTYNKIGKYYSIDYHKSVITNIINFYTEIGYEIINRLPEFHQDRIQERHGYEKLKYFLEQVPKGQYSYLKKYMIVMYRQNYGIKTIKDYSSKISKLLSALHKVDMDDVTADEVNDFLDAMLKQQISFSYINQVYSAVKIHITRVTKKDDFEMEKLVRPRKRKSLPKFISAKEVMRMIDAIDNPKHLLIFYLLYGAGLRRSEVLNLEINHIYWDRNQILVFNAKGQKDRMVNLSNETKLIMEDYFKVYKPVKYLIEGQYPGEKYSESSVAAVIKRAKIKAQVARKVTPHVLRHSFATHMMDNGVLLPMIQKLLGHKDIKTTMIYTHVTKQNLENIESPLDRLLKNRNSDDRNVDI